MNKSETTEASEERLSDLLRGVQCAAPQIVELARQLIALTTHPEPAANGPAADEPAAVRADNVMALARMRNVLDAEIAHRLRAAEQGDVLRHSARTTLERDAHWAGGTAHAMVAAARFAERYPAVAELWGRGRIPLETVATLARGTRLLPGKEVGELVEALLPALPHLSTRELRIAVGRAVDLLLPTDRNEREQVAHDRRFLAFSEFKGITSFHGELPTFDGAALRAALGALGESLRIEGDGLTKGQRNVDALMTLVNAAAAHGDLPSSAAGLPVAATVTIGLTEADRIAQHWPPTAQSLTQAVGATSAPAAFALTPDSSTTLGDAAVRFALCHGTITGVVVDDRTEGPISKALAVTRHDPLAVGRRTRLATAAQRTALAVRDGGCVVCNRPPAECQTHHVVPWNEGGGTDLSNLALVCWVHHRQVDLNRWTLSRNTERSPGDRYWQVVATPRHQWRPPESRRA